MCRRQNPIKDRNVKGTGTFGKRSLYGAGRKESLGTGLMLQQNLIFKEDFAHDRLV